MFFPWWACPEVVLAVAQAVFLVEAGACLVLMGVGFVLREGRLSRGGGRG